MVKNGKVLKDAIFHQLFKEKIEERDNLQDENGYGKFIVLEMKERYDSLEDEEKIKILDTLSATTKANQKWAEGKRKQMKDDK